MSIQKKALLVLGCLEVPIQMALALFSGYYLEKDGYEVTTAGNPSVMKLIKTSDPGGHYLRRLITLEKCIEGITDRNDQYDLCICFVHNDAGISYAATMRYLLAEIRFVTLVFGRNAEELSGSIEFDGVKIVEPAVHNPIPIRRKLQEVMGWGASKN
ncbi:MAG: hypothetical protein BWY45_00046 [Euryarchaeota archaeon ADurb.Bin294]|nr:MAG: hypothetical protein BWY45_00046 [Euryarchaeota archaeon ADurb.Bin294]